MNHQANVNYCLPVYYLNQIGRFLSKKLGNKNVSKLFFKIIIVNKVLQDSDRQNKIRCIVEENPWI